MSDLRPLTPLCILADKYETDKGGRSTRYGGCDGDTCHQYTPLYWDLLGGRREQVKRVLEIGINAGSSLRMWEEFFPNAKIIGIDLNPGCLFQTERITCVQADQNNPDQLRSAVDWVGGGPFDLIVDDGSHELEHQITSIRILLPYLADDGIYVVEDLHDDCNPALVGDHVQAGYEWYSLAAPGGIGEKAKCGACGQGPERLLIAGRKLA